MRYNRAEGVNFDFILALKKNGNKVETVKIPIERHDKEIERALSMIEDEDYDATDIYNLFRRILTGHVFPYCFKHDYYESNISDINPVDFNSYKYSKELREKIKRKAYFKLLRLPKEDRDKSENIREAEEKARKELSYQIKKDKEKLFDSILPCIYAQDYEESLERNKVKDDYILFSNDRHGDGRRKEKIGYHAEHKINDDLSVTVRTNFCYGTSTYFNVVVKYKDIELIPYSEWVRYYFAAYTHLLGYTKSYKHYRECWNYCFSFIESFINSAIEDPEKFVSDEINREIKQLMEGLEDIFTNPEDYLGQINVKKWGNDERYIGIIGVRNLNERELEEYYIAPQEISMIYRMEKISGAIRFLKSLRKIEELYPKINVASKRIVEMNQEMLPEVKAAIPPVNEEILNLKRQLKPLEFKLEKCEKAIEKFENQLSKRLKDLWETEEIEKAKNRFESLNPKYLELKQLREKLKPEVQELQSKLYKREEVLKKLNGFKSLIEDNI